MQTRGEVKVDLNGKGRQAQKQGAGVIHGESEKRGNQKSTSTRHEKGIKTENPILTNMHNEKYTKKGYRDSRKRLGKNLEI